MFYRARGVGCTGPPIEGFRDVATAEAGAGVACWAACSTHAYSTTIPRAIITSAGYYYNYYNAGFRSSEEFNVIHHNNYLHHRLSKSPLFVNFTLCEMAISLSTQAAAGLAGGVCTFDVTLGAGVEADEEGWRPGLTVYHNDIRQANVMTLYARIFSSNKPPYCRLSNDTVHTQSWY